MRIDTKDTLYYSLLHGDGTTNTRRADWNVGGGERATAAGESPVLREIKSAGGRAWGRRVCRGTVPVVLRREDGAAQSGAGTIFPSPVAWLLRMPGLGTRHGVARGGLVGSARVSRSGADRDRAGSFDDIADAAIDRPGHPSDGVHMGASVSGHRWADQGENDCDRRDDTRSERGLAQHRAARHRRDV